MRICQVWFSNFLLALASPMSAQQHAARGIVLSTSPTQDSITISCEAIPGYMDAMDMPLIVHDLKVLRTLKAGTSVSFEMVQRGSQLYAESIRIESSANLESEPLEAGQLTALRNALHAAPSDGSMRIGQLVADFQLTDQTSHSVRLSQFRGQVVALTFGYSRCPNPNYCFRLSNNLALVEKRFHDRAGRDFVLLTIAIDPEYDQGQELKEYADTWKANPAVWHFLTGSLTDVHRIAAMFGMNFWSDDGLVTHSLHTILIDRNGELAANLEGNAFSAQQLGDLLQTVMDRR